MLLGVKDEITLRLRCHRAGRARGAMRVRRENPNRREIGEVCGQRGRKFRAVFILKAD